MAGLLRSFGGSLVRRDPGTLEYEIELAHYRHHTMPGAGRTPRGARPARAGMCCRDL